MVAVIDAETCVKCGTCVEECPSGAISLDQKPTVNLEDCVDCGTCEDVCPSGAVVIT